MSAIITERFRKNNVSLFMEDIANVANNFYLGIGKSNKWPNHELLDEDGIGYNVTEPLGTPGDDFEILNNITTLVGILPDNYSRVIPNIAAKSNHRHKAYNPFDPDCFYQEIVDGVLMYPCYVNVDDKIYLCLKSPSIQVNYNFPSSTSRAPISLSDNSIWIYIYTVETTLPINTTQFVSVPQIPTLNGQLINNTLTAISGASGNLVFGFSVEDSGSNYNNTPVIEYVTPTQTINLKVIVEGGKVIRVSYQDDVTPLSWIHEVGYCRVVSGNARVLPNIAPTLGFGSNPSNDLNSYYLGIKGKIIENVSDDNDGAFIPYRQISLIKNAEANGTVTDFEKSMNCLQNLQLDTSPGTVSTGSIITQPSTPRAKAIVDYYDSTSKKLYYHQSFETGFTPFALAQILIDGGTTANVTEINNSEYAKGTGEVLFIENRKKITRVSGQTEDLTIILQF